MLLKIIGLTIILITSTQIGAKMAQRFEGRLKDLRGFSLALQILEREIAFLSNSLPDAMIKVSYIKGNPAVIFRECGEILKSKEGYCVEEAWTMAFDKHVGNTFLEDEDKQILLNLGRSLGSYDIENQSQNIKTIQSQLCTQEKNAEELIVKNTKLYKSLGVLGGIAIVIVLL